VSTSTAPEPREWRRVALYLVAVAMMLVSIKGQVESLESRLGGFAYVLAIANDVGAIIALDALFSADRKSSIRKWAWTVILLTSGTGGVLNMWHVSVDAVIGPDGKLNYPPLPKELAYLVGAEPILALLLLSHLIGLVIAERRDRQTASTASDREVSPAGVGREDREVVSPGPRVPTASLVPATASLVATVGAGDREVPAVSTASSRPAVAASKRPTAVRQAVTPAPSPRLRLLPGKRPEWMTDELVAAVVASMRKAGAPAKRYGEPTLCRDHRLSDGSPITSHKAKTILRYIDDHDLLRVAS
jgi:hypothetical protein